MIIKVAEMMTEVNAVETIVDAMTTRATAGMTDFESQG
jgi:hypothetical protein